MAETTLVPRPAATLILARDAADGIEIFMLQRTHTAVFMPGVYVFPGGAVDPADASEELHAYCRGLDDAAASRLLGLERGGLSYLVAAVRECFEEAGLLLAESEHGRPLDYAELRARLCAGELSLADLCRQYGLRLALDRLAYLAHWITPPGPPRRYDTRFFVATAPADQLGCHDGKETVAHLWISPEQALERHRRGELPLSSPTIRTIKTLVGFDSTEALMRHLRAPRPVVVNLPRTGIGRDGPRVFHKGDPVYAELAKLDPDNTGSAAYEIVPGVVTRLSPRVRRLTAPNPGFMTGPGTNTYLIGDGDELAVIDPGPDDDRHLQALLQACGGRVRWILVTHTHMDHSPGAARFKAATGAEVLGMPPPPYPSQDQSFRPDRVLGHGERLTIGDYTLRAIHTPGHASNHLCYLLEEEGMLFTGDHIMQGSTVVISPPDGDMRAYLDSLMALHDLEIAYLAPAHGFLMDEPYAVIDRLVSHRLAREAKVLQALRSRARGTIAELVPLAYDDVPPAVHPLAARSLLAHLLKLEQEGWARRQDEIWAYVEG